MTEDAELVARAVAWIAGDPDPETRAPLEAAVNAGDVAALRAALEPPLRFGTAGLRGLIGPGPARMNRAVVARTTAGLCRHLLATLPDATGRGLCIGYDAREGSHAFAQEAAGVARGMGLSVHLFDGVGPTPWLAHAVRALGAAGGVMVTASHNPPAYNGFKVYGPDGVQISEPTDAEITAEIEACEPASALPRRPLDGVDSLGRASRAEYLASIARSCPADDDLPAPTLRIAHTSLHGVGAALCREALAAAGFRGLHEVGSQREPDPRFPTVAFPNPEEPGAMDAVLALAAREGCELAFANDPDADRLAVAARDADGEMRPLDGNQLGVLLADHLLRRAPQDGRNVVVTTIVSTQMLAPLAAAHGARCDITLTGFKWLMRRAARCDAEGSRFVFAFEEALGYAAGDAVRDKDGIMAAVLAAQLAHACAQRGETLWDRLRALYRQHGYHVSGQHAVRVAGSDGMARLVEATSHLQREVPGALGGLALVSHTDHAARLRTYADGSTEELELPATRAVTLCLQGGHRVCVRPSGTEPKLKIYLEAVRPGALDPDTAMGEGRALVERLRDATLEALGLSGPPPT